MIRYISYSFGQSANPMPKTYLRPDSMRGMSLKDIYRALPVGGQAYIESELGREAPVTPLKVVAAGTKGTGNAAGTNKGTGNASKGTGHASKATGYASKELFVGGGIGELATTASCEASSSDEASCEASCSDGGGSTSPSPQRHFGRRGAGTPVSRAIATGIGCSPNGSLDFESGTKGVLRADSCRSALGEQKASIGG